MDLVLFHGVHRKCGYQELAISLMCPISKVLVALQESVLYGIWSLKHLESHVGSFGGKMPFHAQWDFLGLTTVK